MTNFRTAILVVLAAVVLTVVFWRPLWSGGGLIGGDVYSYYLPQKTFYADRLHAGEFPLWNNLVGHGYPVLGESQTGACYPPYLLAYGGLDISTAYNAIHLLHYVLTFSFTWLYARKIGLGTFASLFAALVFTYGWFPARACWEWAIVTGAYLPLALWCVESFLQSGRWRHLICLSVALGLQLLAGHYNLAFITQLVLIAYVPLRLWYVRERLATPISQRPTSALSASAVSLIFGFAVAAVQLLPSWELKQVSQRASMSGPREETLGTGYEPGHGHLPPIYLTQLVLPWDWYPLGPTGELDRALGNLQTDEAASRTNKIEAHLYVGLVPIVLVCWRIIALILARLSSGRYRQGRMLVESSPAATSSRAADPNPTAGPPGRMLWLWGMFAAAAVFYATGWLVPVTRHLPGFAYFTGPGRYGIVATLAAALIAADVLDRWLSVRRLRLFAAAFVLLAFAATVFDLYLVSRLVTDAVLVPQPPIRARAESNIARLLRKEARLPRQEIGPARMLAPGANLATLTGSAQTPVYLGIGPAVYFDSHLQMPTLQGDENDAVPLRAADGQVEWLQRAGVTHLLSFKPLEADSWPAELIYEGRDPMLSPAWAHYEPLYLYRLKGTRGRAAFAQPAAGSSVIVREYSANRVVIESDSGQNGRLILTDLMFPGWKVFIDEQSAEPLEFESMFRAVDVPAGKHTVVWSYEPTSVYWGIAISLVSLSLLAAAAHLRYWHPRLLPFFDEEPTA